MGLKTIYKSISASEPMRPVAISYKMKEASREDLFLACCYTYNDINAFILVFALLALWTIIIVGVNILESNILNYDEPLRSCLLYILYDGHAWRHHYLIHVITSYLKKK